MEFRSGYYCFFRGKEFKMRSTTNSWKIYLNENSFPSEILEIPKKHAKEKIESAYIVRTKAKYKKFTFTTFQNEDLKKEGKVRLYLESLDFAAYDSFNLDYRNEDASIVVDLNEIEDIWEERLRLAQFYFKTEKIKYIKKSSSI